MKGKPIGFANFTYVDEDGDAELTAIYILPEYQTTWIWQKTITSRVKRNASGRQLFVYVESKNDECPSFL